MAELTSYSVAMIIIGFVGLFISSWFGICLIGIGVTIIIMEFREDKKERIRLNNEATE